MSASVSRRQFLRNAAETTATVTGLPYVVPSTVFGQGGAIQPSNRIGILSRGKVRLFDQKRRIDIMSPTI